MDEELTAAPEIAFPLPLFGQIVTFLYSDKEHKYNGSYYQHKSNLEKHYPPVPFIVTQRESFSVNGRNIIRFCLICSDQGVFALTVGQKVN